MKMRVRKKINWMKRMVAAGMAVCMVLTTPPSFPRKVKNWFLTGSEN